MAIAIKTLPVVDFAQYEPQLDMRSVGVGMVPYGLMAIGQLFLRGRRG